MRISFDRLDDRPRDYVRKRDLAVTLRGAIVVENAAVLLEDLDWHRAKARRRRNGETLLHVLDDLFRRAGDGFGRGIRNRSCSRLGFLCAGSTCYRACFRFWLLRHRCAVTSGRAAQEGAKILLPRFIDELRTGLIAPQQTL